MVEYDWQKSIAQEFHFTPIFLQEYKIVSMDEHQRVGLHIGAQVHSNSSDWLSQW
jgi:hypothetical protein